MTDNKSIESIQPVVEKSIRVRLYIYAGLDPQNSKSNIHLLRSIQKEDRDETYLFPPVHQPIRGHVELMKLPIVQSCLKSIKTRNHYRRIVVSLTPTVKKFYFDEEENARYADEYLEEMSTPTKEKPDETETTTTTKLKPLQTITKDAVILRFNGVSPNPKTWLNNLEHECVRLDIPTNRYCEVLRLFIDGIAIDWFNMSWTLHGAAPWERWKQSFLDHFATKGWSDTSHAINYKYIRGSLSEYTIKKLGLLAETDPDLSEFTRITLVIAGIPYDLHSQLDRNKIKTTNQLITKINQIDRFSPRQPTQNSSSNATSTNNDNRLRNSSNRERKTCTYCTSIGKPGRYHLEADCLTKKYRSNSDSTNLNSNSTKSSTNALSSTTQKSNNFTSNVDKNFKLTHNTELENLFNTEIDPKN